MLSISLIVLLLTTYSYSAPLESKTDPVVTQFETTTVEITDVHDKINSNLLPDEKSKNVPDIRSQREFYSDYPTEVPVLNTTKQPNNGSDTINVLSVLTAVDMEQKLNEFYKKTMEDQKTFEQKAIVPENNETSTNSKSFYANKYIKDYFDLSIMDKDLDTPTIMNDYSSPRRENEESTRPVEEYPSSADTFGNITGLLYNKRDEETTTESHVPHHGDEHVQNQLSQSSTVLFFLLAASLFCIFLVATIIAIVKIKQSLKRKIRIIEMEAHLDNHQQILK